MNSDVKWLASKKQDLRYLMLFAQGKQSDSREVQQYFQELEQNTRKAISCIEAIVKLLGQR